MTPVPTSAPRSEPLAAADGRDDDRRLKRARVLELLEAAGAEAVLLTGAPAVAWYLDGGRQHVSLAADPIAAVRVGLTEDEVFVTSNEAARLTAEELPPGLSVRTRAWYEPLPSAEELGAVPERMLDAGLRAARAVLLPHELARFRRLCADAARVVTDVLLAAEAAWSERRVAAELGGRLIAVGADPLVTLVAGSGRAEHPHPLPTDAALGRRALVVVCARRDGMIANLSRWVSFEAPTDAEADAERRILRVESAAFEATRPGAALSSVLEEIAAAYPRNGFEDDRWRRHHQGGAAGYAGRDPRATPSVSDVVHAGQAFAWNPWAPGAKVEDTVLLRTAEDGGGIEPLTVDERWPTTEVDGRMRPVTLRR